MSTSKLQALGLITEYLIFKADKKYFDSDYISAKQILKGLFMCSYLSTRSVLETIELFRDSMSITYDKTEERHFEIGKEICQYLIDEMS